MKTNPLNLQLLARLLIAMLLSSSLLITACSSDNDVNEINAADAITDTVDANNAVANKSNTSLTTKEQPDASIEAIEPEVTTTNNVINPEQTSLVNNPTQAGTPEDTVKQALDTLYYGNVKEAATYYQVDIANFEQELAKTQYAFQQTVEGVTITDTTYNDDKTRATIDGELMLKNQKQPAPLSYELQKIDGKWKILG